jgi:hypothetical protein
LLLGSILLPLLSPPVVFGQEPSGEAELPRPGDASSEDEDIVYYIRNIEYNITGRTRLFALIDHGKFVEGERLQGKAKLEQYIQEKTQILINQRVLEEVRIDYTLAEAGEDGSVPVDLLVSTADTWNIIVIPYPQYDSNKGFELTLKGRDYNFLGTMNPLRIDLGYNLTEDKLWDFSKGNFKFELDSDTPFYALGYTWHFDFDHIFSYTYGDPLSYTNKTGLSMELPYKQTVFTFGFTQGFVLHEENSERYKPEYGEHFDGFYLFSELYTQWEIPTSLTVYRYGELTWIPKVAGKINYRPRGELDDIRKGPSLTLSQTLGFGRVNWIGNYRGGAEALVENNNEWNFYQNAWNKNASLTLIYHQPLTDFFALSSRLQYRHWFDSFYQDDYYDEAGDVLRGVLNRSLNARYMLSWNVDLPLRALRFMPSQWLRNRKLHLFDFELHASPFLDMALVRAPLNEINFTPGEMIFAGGMELIFFPAIMRSIYLRVSVGFNLNTLAETKKLPGGSSREIFIGLGHFY